MPLERPDQDDWDRRRHAVTVAVAVAVTVTVHRDGQRKRGAARTRNQPRQVMHLRSRTGWWARESAFWRGEKAGWRPKAISWTSTDGWQGSAPPASIFNAAASCHPPW